MKDLEKRVSIIEEKLGIVYLENQFEKKEGKWYKASYKSKYLVYAEKLSGNDVLKGYGFCDSGNWNVFTGSYASILKTVEATHQEVEEALIAEAKRRYKVGDKVCLIRRNVGGKYKNEIHLTDFSYETDNQLYCDGNLLIFDDGVWAEVIEQQSDKFAELKEAHRKGAVIQWRREIDGDPIWKDCNEKDSPMWCEFNEYRIKPTQQTSSLEQDIQQLKDKYKQYKFTITIEDNI